MVKKENTNKFTNKKVQEVKGDAIDLFFKTEGNAIFMHGANCKKIMGAGIALQVRQMLPPLYFLDHFDTRTPTQRYGSYGATILAGGENQPIKLGVNLYTQYIPGPVFSLDALKTSLTGFKLSIPEEQRPLFEVIVPQIGCGIGGGDWDVVKPIILDILSDFRLVLVEYQAPEPPTAEDKRPEPLESVKKPTRRGKKAKA